MFGGSVSGTSKKHIGGVDYEFWSRLGTVGHVVHKSETKVWSQGGGGHVGPNGGTITAPTVSSSTQRWQQVRVEGDDGEPYTVTLHEDVIAFPGDRVALIYGRTGKGTDEGLYGWKNFREKYHWWFDCAKLVRPEHRQGLDGMVFRLTHNKIIGFVLLFALAFAWHVVWSGGVFYIPGAWPMLLLWTFLFSLPIRIWYGILAGRAQRKIEEEISALATALVDRKGAEAGRAAGA